MAKLAEIARTLPESWQKRAHSVQKCERRRRITIAKPRRLTNYERCMQELNRMGAEGLFALGKGCVVKSRCKNSVSSEKAGRIGLRTCVRRWQGSHVTNTYRSRAI